MPCQKNPMLTKINSAVSEQATVASQYTGWQETTTSVSRPLLPTMVCLTLKVNTFQQRKCGLLTGIWADLSGTKKIKSHSVHLPIPLLDLWKTGIHLSWLYTVNWITGSLSRKEWK